MVSLTVSSIRLLSYEDVYDQLFQHNGLKERSLLDKHIFIDSGQKGGQLEVD